MEGRVELGYVASRGSGEAYLTYRNINFRITVTPFIRKADVYVPNSVGPRSSLVPAGGLASIPPPWRAPPRNRTSPHEAVRRGR